MFHVNLAVDIYNLISMETGICLGAHDLKGVNGNITLRFTTGTEKFLPLGQTEPKEVKANEYSYIDDRNEILCRLEIRQVEKTKVTEEINVPHEYLLKTANQIIEETTKYCKGIGTIIFDSEI